MTLAGKRSARRTTERIAGDTWLYASRRSTPGILFARLGWRPEKIAARTALLSVLGTRDFESLSILTMPGMTWAFEHALLYNRESLAKMRDPFAMPRHTFICAFERDEAIFRASLKNIPGAGLTQLPTAHFATTTIRNRKITRYHRCSFEDMAMLDCAAPPFDVAWLDFNGQLTARRLHLLAMFWHTRVRSTLFVTFMRARSMYGVEALASALDGAHPFHQRAYADGAPMMQIGFHK